MRVVVDYDLCESNALCMAAAPEVFTGMPLRVIRAMVYPPASDDGELHTHGEPR